MRSQRYSVVRRRANPTQFRLGEVLEKRLLLASIAGKVWNDYDADGAVDSTEPGIPGSIVYQDLNDNGIRDAMGGQTIDSTDVPKFIPDLGQVTSNLVVTDIVGGISDVNVTISITHTYDGDLKAELTGPTGLQVTLMNRPGGAGNFGENFWGTTFDDEADVPIEQGDAPYSGSFRPTAPLSAYDNLGANGTWRLRVTDSAGQDVGTLDSWSITVETSEPSRVADGAGNYSFTNVAVGTYQVRTEIDPDFAATAPADGTRTVTVGASDALTGQNFGARRTPGDVRGTTWRDVDGDGTFDAGEPGLPGVTVYVDLNENGTYNAGAEPSAVSGGDGTFDIADVPPGAWLVREVVPAGFEQTSPSTSGGAPLQAFDPVIATSDQPRVDPTPPATPDGPTDAHAHPFYKFSKAGAKTLLDAFTADDNARWSRTATSGGGLTQGQATIITWNVVADGTPIDGHNGESAGSSNLRSFLNGIYGSEAVWSPIFDRIFNAWSDLTGFSYQRVSYDDGGPGGTELTSGSGQISVRADIRIGGHFIDGNSNILAYNFFPDVGDMVIDTGDNFYSGTGNQSLGLRNVLSHEHGHGMGLNHVMPVSQTKLMEPFVSFNFDGPQPDDILGANRLYGDRLEKGSGNDTRTTATVLGVLDSGSSTTSNVSIDDDGDADLFRFTITGRRRAAVTLNPVGTTYLSGAQGGADPVPFNAKAQSDLTVEILRADGTVIATADNTGLGLSEELRNVPLNSVGDYFVRVGGGNDAAQMYNFTLSVDGSFIGAHFVEVASGGAVDSIDFGNKPTGQPASTVVGRQLFYGNSAFASDAAIAPDKQALRAGQSPGFANFTSYSRGINGILIDVQGLPAGNGLGAADFFFEVSGINLNGALVAAAAPTSVTVARGAGTGGSDRVAVAWADGAVRNTWLRVTMLTGANTGLVASDVFSFGNLVGETGNSASAARVDFADLSAIRNNLRGGSVAVNNHFDFNRDGVVNTKDLAIARANQQGSLSLVPAVTARSRTSAPRRTSFSEVVVALVQTQRQQDEEIRSLLA